MRRMDCRLRCASSSLRSSSRIFSCSFFCSSACSFSSFFWLRRSSRSRCFCSRLRSFSSRLRSRSCASSSFCFLRAPGGGGAGCQGAEVRGEMTSGPVTPRKPLRPRYPEASQPRPAGRMSAPPIGSLSPAHWQRQSHP
jgi:hypothetical protein